LKGGTMKATDKIWVQCREAERLLRAASHALKSYALGNAATDLANEMAESIDKFLSTGEPQTIEGRKEAASELGQRTAQK
jgi:hypothetical protein